jgi:hypothetical protein
VHDDPSMVGRVEEHDTIRAALRNCLTSGCPPVLIGGEAGIGKSHLVGEALRDWDGVVLRAAPHPGDGLYSPISRILRVCRTSFGEDVIDHAGAILLSDARQPDDDGAVETLADGFAATLREVSQRAPTVVVLEDLHWASAATIGLVPRLATGLADAPMLLMLSYRSDELARSHPVRSMRAELRRSGPLVEMVLEPLGESDTAELIRDVIGDAPSQQLAAAIHDRAGGIPLFIKELTAALVEAGALTGTEAGVELASGATVPMPESIVDAVLLRARELTDRAGHAAELAAVLGVKVDLDVLAEIAGTEHVDVLLESSLLVETDVGAEFRHALVRDALYRTIPWARRRAHHQRVANVMADRGAAPRALAQGGHRCGSRRHGRGPGDLTVRRGTRPRSRAHRRRRQRLLRPGHHVDLRLRLRHIDRDLEHGCGLLPCT